MSERTTITESELAQLMPDGEALTNSKEYQADWLPRHIIKSPIFHYTNAIGLCGIIQSNSLFATHFGFLNDKTESIHSVALATSLIQSMQAKTKDVHLIALCEAMQKKLDDLPYFFCSISFCEDDDLLSQWNLYGGSGGGYAIGFRLDHLNLANASFFGHPSIPKLRCVFKKVVYDSNEQEYWINFILQIIMTSFSEKTSKIGFTNYTEAIKFHAVYLVACLSEFIQCFKNEAFESEREWRLICTGNPEEMTKHLNFRPVGGILRPYIPIPMIVKDGPWSGKLPIIGVRYGPTHDPELCETSLSLLLARFGYPNLVNVLPSEIPYRG